MNPELEPILTRAQTLHDDVDYKAVAAWKSPRQPVGAFPRISLHHSIQLFGSFRVQYYVEL
ncbi:MAG: hypothetical protein ACHP9V_04945 [Terriglobales bacterium]